MQENSQFYLLVGGFCLSALANVGLAVKFFLERKTNAEINAYNQLSQLFESLQKQVEKKEVKDKEHEQEYENLDSKFDMLRAKVKQARFDLLDLRQTFHDIKRFVKENNIDDERISQTIDEIELKLTEIAEQLK